MYEVRVKLLQRTAEWPFARAHENRLKAFHTLDEARLWAQGKAKLAFPDDPISIYMNGELICKI